EPEHLDFDAVFGAADRALYEAKRRGRDAVVTAEDLGHVVGESQLNIQQFVGRKDEMRKLLRLLDQTVSAGPAVVSIRGEAGVGKTTLVQQLLPEIRLRSGSLVRGRCLETGVKRPYAPWAEAIAAVHQLGVTTGRTWRALARLAPETGVPNDEPRQNKSALFAESAS